MSSFLLGSKLRSILRKLIKLIQKILFFFIFFSGARALKGSYITCSRDDGGGAQIHGRLSVLGFCDFFGFRYINTKISGAHFSDGANWDLKWNTLFDFGPDVNSLSEEIIEVKAVSCRDLSIKISKIILTGKCKKHYLFQMESAHQWTDANPRILNSSREKFRRMFVPVDFNGDEEIVIHLRRGNDSTAGIRVESDDILFLRLRNLTHTYPGKKIRVYTNAYFALPEEFTGYVIVDFESNPFQAISHMAKSEILIIAKSSMSYVAALVSRGQVFAPNFWHPMMNDWNVVARLETKYNSEAQT